MVTDQQVKKYRSYRQSGKLEEEAAARAGMSAKTARKWETGPLPSHIKKPHDWRTRENPFEKVWSTHVLPLLETDGDGKLQATTIVERLEVSHPEVCWSKHLRTLQRQVQVWRAMEGPSKEVVFPQEHPPGQEGAYDFTHAEELGITIQGVPFPHLFFQYIMSFSGHRFIQLAFGETYEALSTGLQEAFWTLGGVPQRVRHDNLSAATHELKGLEPGRKLTARYAGLLSHYGVDSSHITPGKSNENGVAEKSHDVLKTRLDQVLRLGKSRDFESIDAYLDFAQAEVTRLNGRQASKWMVEQATLRSLPLSGRVPNYTEFKKTVRRWSVIRIGGNIYSLPSRLIGQEVMVRVHPEKIEIFFHAKCMGTFPRLHGQNRHRIDYRHIIASLVRKPGAFLNYRFREELFPSLVFRKAYDALMRHRGERAYVDYVRILYQAAFCNETDVELALELLLETRSSFDSKDVESLVAPRRPNTVTSLLPLKPVLLDFDNLLSKECHACFQNAPVALAS